MQCALWQRRFAAARRLAEAGCSANEIAAITGHASLEEVARYTKAAEQRKLARSAMDRLVREQHGIPTSDQAEGLGMGGVEFGKTNPKTPYEVNDLQNSWRPVGDCDWRRKLLARLAFSTPSPVCTVPCTVRQMRGGEAG